MLTAHLPSGYVLARSLPNRIPLLMPAALIGAVFPDLDMLWFHFVDHKAFHHHRYWVHIPFFWLVVAALVLPLAWWAGHFRTAAVFFAAILLHLLLDTIGGGIMWAAPFSDHLFELVTVPPDHGHWIVSFILHWTFLAEVAIWLVALTLWLRRNRVP
jgi:inner membrane protein